MFKGCTVPSHQQKMHCKKENLFSLSHLKGYKMKTFEIIRFPYHIWWKHEDFFFQDVDLGVKSFSETSGLQRWSKTCSNQLVLSIAPILDRFGQLHLKIMTILQKVSQIPLPPKKEIPICPLLNLYMCNIRRPQFHTYFIFFTSRRKRPPTCQTSISKTVFIILCLQRVVRS